MTQQTNKWDEYKIKLLDSSYKFLQSITLEGWSDWSARVFAEHCMKQTIEWHNTRIREVIDNMIAEEPSNYPTPDGQNAVYGVLEKLKYTLLEESIKQ